MIPPVFDYVRPSDLGEALRILKEREGEAKVLSGGYSLLPLIKLRLAQPALLVDLRDVGGLDGISRIGDEFRIGGRATPRAARDPARDPDRSAGRPHGWLLPEAGAAGGRFLDRRCRCPDDARR